MGANPGRRALFKALLPDRGLDPLDSGPLLADHLALIREIAAGWKGKLARGATPWLEIGAACAGHGVCAAVCPTGALRRYAGERHAGLEFDPAACIACGVCEMVCPETALAIGASAPADGSAGLRVRLSRHELRACARCDNEFPVRGEHELCLTCRKETGLFTHGISPRSDAT